MNRSAVLIGLGIAVALQIVIVAGLVANAAMPLWTGTEIRLKTIPVDPRSMFRGNYTQLNYDIGQLPDNALEEYRYLRIGERVYVSLKLTDSGIYSFLSASLDKPSTGVFIRGRLKNRYSPYRVNYGVNAFFAPKSKAIQLTKDLVQGGVAVLMVTDSGRAALSNVVANPPKDENQP
tara:strand:- start:9558 stop:10088 length:531 start_codon:yes stop_codon:yes gene_type:complete